MLRRLLLPLSTAIGVAVTALFVLLPSSAAADGTLTATVGPGFTISLRDANGARVTHLDPGTYTIVVSDLAAQHNFHLRGPGVDQATDIDGTGTVSWTVTLTDGTYRFQCDPHSNSMNGSFTVGSAQPPPPPPPPPATGFAKGTTLRGTVGPGFTITLKDAAGKKVRKVRANRRYTIRVADKSAQHNFHLLGAGVNKKTAVGARVNTTWKLRFKKGKTYRFRCDPHKAAMKGSFRAS